MALTRACSSSYDVTISAAIEGSTERTSRQVSMPEPSGSRASSSATAGRRAGIRRVASSAEPDSPTTSKSSSSSSSSRSPRRTISWSSSRKRRMLICGSSHWTVRVLQSATAGPMAGQVQDLVPCTDIALSPRLIDMSSSPTADRYPPTAGQRAPNHRPDVVAGLVNDGSAYAVAHAAAIEAARRGGRVKFVQVAPPGVSDDDRQDLDQATFRAALRALRGLQRVPCTFEVVEGEAGAVLIERSSGAALLVVDRDARDLGRDVASRCQELADCDVLTVSRPTSDVNHLPA